MKRTLCITVALFGLASCGGYEQFEQGLGETVPTGSVRFAASTAAGYSIELGLGILSTNLTYPTATSNCTSGTVLGAYNAGNTAVNPTSCVNLTAVGTTDPNGEGNSGDYSGLCPGTWDVSVGNLGTGCTAVGGTLSNPIATCNLNGSFTPPLTQTTQIGVTAASDNQITVWCQLDAAQQGSVNFDVNLQ